MADREGVEPQLTFRYGKLTACCKTIMRPINEIKGSVIFGHIPITLSMAPPLGFGPRRFD